MHAGIVLLACAKLRSALYRGSRLAHLSSPLVRYAPPRISALQSYVA
jgi:hypothetical protein